MQKVIITAKRCFNLLFYSLFYHVDQFEVAQEIDDLQIKLQEKLVQLQQAPPNPLIRERLERTIQQLHNDIRERTSILMSLE